MIDENPERVRQPLPSVRKTSGSPAKCLAKIGVRDSANRESDVTEVISRSGCKLGFLQLLKFERLKEQMKQSFQESGQIRTNKRLYTRSNGL